MTHTLAGQRDWPYDGREILADGVIHGLGLALAVVGSIILLGFLFFPGDGAGWPAHLVYCTTLLITLSASAAYNLWPVSATKWVLRRIDHAMIFGLIAGTYTPFLVRAGTTLTTWLLVAIWAVSLIGMVVKLLNLGRTEWLSTLLYIGLGWSGVIALKTLSDVLPMSSLVLIFVGGGLYCGGTIFHHWRSLRFQNAIWHGFVLAAAVCHFAAIVTALELG